MTILLEPLAIPASVIHDHAYGYGYLASSLFYLECIAEFMEEIDLRGLQYLLRRIKEEAQKARELDAGFRIDGRRLAVARDRARKADRKPPRESTRGG